MKGPAVTRPLVRWHGGKYLQAPRIIEQFPDHKRYVEPYGGGASVLLRKPRAFAEVYNDLDKEIVNLFRVVRDRGPELAAALFLTPFSRDEFSQAYLPCEDELEQARRTVVRSFMGFGSDSHAKITGFRGRSERSGTTPAHDWANYPKALTATIERLRGVVIENRPAIDVLIQYDGPDTLHYIDPPYVHSTRSKTHGMHVKSYRYEMTDEQHRALGHAVNGLTGAVVISGYRCDLYDEIYAGWDRIEKTGPFCDKAQERVEVLWMRNCDHGLFAQRP